MSFLPATNSVQVENNSKIDIKLSEFEDEKQIEVIISKLTEDGSIKKYISKVELDELLIFNEKFNSSKTEEDCFNVLKEFGIIPNSIDFDCFMKTSKSRYNRLFRFLPLLRFNQNLYNDECFFNLGFFMATFDGYCTGIWNIPFLFFSCYSEGGTFIVIGGILREGSVRVVSYGEEMWCEIIGWIGITTVSRFDPFGGSAVGFAFKGNIAGI